MANVERSGWRDMAFSKHHRLWGRALAMTDIDFLVIERLYSTPKAIIEYKHEAASLHNIREDGNIKVYKNLGDAAMIPAFIVRYSKDFLTYLVHPLNDIARIYVPKRISMTEMTFVSMLYEVRGSKIPSDTILFIRNREPAMASM